MARDAHETLGKRMKVRRKQLKLSQEQLAELSGLGQADISKLERGDMQQTTKIAQLARALQADAYWLATGEGGVVSITALEVKSVPGPASTLTPILAWEYPDELPPGEFVLVQRLDILLAANNGNGQFRLAFSHEHPEAFRADWIREMKLKPDKLAVMRASGDSMEPTINDGDSVVVDTSQTTVVDSKVYALLYEGGERVKRLFTLPGGGLRIASDNPLHQPIELRPENTGNIRIIGRVVHRAGTGRL